MRTAKLSKYGNRFLHTETCFRVDTVVRCDAQSGFALIRSWHLLLLIRIVPIVSGASNQSQSLQSEDSASRFLLACLSIVFHLVRRKTAPKHDTSAQFFWPQ